MTKNEALQEFFRCNQIEYAEVCKPGSAEFDVLLRDLPERVEKWLAAIAPEDQPVFLEALSRYVYLTEKECQRRFEQLIAQLEKALGEKQISLGQTLFVTVESSDGLKSGGDNVRTDLQRRNMGRIGKRQIVAAHSRLPSNALEGVAAVVFADDMIGTGKTLWREFCAFCEKYQIKGQTRPYIYYMCLSQTEKAFRHLQKNFNNMGYSVTAIYREEWLSHKAFLPNSPEYKTVDRYEREIAAYFGSRKPTYRMGFEKSGTLLSFYYNTPNNTVSSFWRPTDQNRPPFPRDGGECVRPTVATLKKKKQESDTDAYVWAVYRSTSWNQKNR